VTFFFFLPLSLHLLPIIQPTKCPFFFSLPPSAVLSPQMCNNPLLPQSDRCASIRFIIIFYSSSVLRCVSTVRFGKRFASIDRLIDLGFLWWRLCLCGWLCGAGGGRSDNAMSCCEVLFGSGRSFGLSACFTRSMFCSFFLFWILLVSFPLSILPLVLFFL
jgi:hypothetical protein